MLKIEVGGEWLSAPATPPEVGIKLVEEEEEEEVFLILYPLFQLEQCEKD